MPIETIDSRLAIEQAMKSQTSFWPQRGAPNSRLEPFARPAFKPTFHLERGERIFTIGSCFARNVEGELAARGFNIPTTEIIKGDEEFLKVGPNVLNNYGVASIFNELSWALDPEDKFDEATNFYEIYPGQFVDLHLSNALKPETLELCQTRRRLIRDAYKVVTECRVIIITLGLTEVWFDKLGRRHLNLAPRLPILRKDPDRFELQVLDYEETMRHLDATMQLIKACCRPDVRIVMTISPVPIQRTFRGYDVFEANTYSKAVLRTAAEKIRSLYSFVDYYPSFEAITLSERAPAWNDDNVHPTKEVISVNVSRMVEAYARDVAQAPEAAPLSLKHLKTLKPQQVFGVLEHRQDIVDGDDEIAVMFVRAAIQLRRYKQAAAALARFAPDDPRVAVLRANVATATGDPAGALRLIGKEPWGRVAKGPYFVARIEAELAIGNFEAAKLTAGKWHKALIRSPEPFRMLGNFASKHGQNEEADNYFRQALELAQDSANVALDYIEHLSRSGRQTEAEAFLEHVAPGNLSHQKRIDQLKMGLTFE